MAQDLRPGGDGARVQAGQEGPHPLSGMSVLHMPVFRGCCAWGLSATICRHELGGELHRELLTFFIYMDFVVLLCCFRGEGTGG